jgi:Tfp pilus assembly protein PilZ
MLNRIKQRAFSRKGYEASLLYAHGNADSYANARMLNSSAGGMCIETEKPLRPGSSIFIKLKDCLPDPYWPESCDCYLGEVRWCEPQNGSDHPRYGVGVRFITSPCKKCGQHIQHRDIRVVDLCPECQNQLEMVTDEKLREGFENYFSGNVL